MGLGVRFTCSEGRVRPIVSHRQLDLQASPGRVTVETLARMATDPAERQELYEMSRPENKELMKAKVNDGMAPRVWVWWRPLPEESVLPTHAQSSLGLRSCACGIPQSRRR